MHDAATGNPMNTAIYFDEIVRCITEVILSYDNDRHQGKEKPGIFGHTTAYIGCSETQNSSNLHIHFMVWVAGMPRTSKEYQTKIATDAFCEEILAYTDNLLKSEYPLEMPVKCPKCETGDLENQAMPNTAYRRYRSGDTEPATHICTECKEEWTCSALLDAVIASTGIVVTSEELARARQDIASIPPQSTSIEDDQRSRVLLTLVLDKNQRHDYKHCASCYKGSHRTKGGTICRFLFPKMVLRNTRISETGRVEIQRRNGYQWLNTYCELLTRIFKVNHDIKLLTCGEGPNVVYYCL